MEESKPTKRSPRRILKGLIFVIVSMGLIAAAIYSPLFLVKNITVEGNVYLTKDDVVDITGVKLGEHLFNLDTAEVKTRLTNDLRIEDAIVKRKLPDTIAVSIKERIPTAIVATDYGYLDLDRRGKIIDGYRVLKHMSVPMITGVMLHDVYIGDDNTNPQVAKVLEFLSYLDEASQNQISEVAIISENNFVAYTTKSVQIRLGDFDRLEEKAKLTKDFLDELKTSPYVIEYVDFSYASPVIKLVTE